MERIIKQRQAGKWKMNVIKDNNRGMGAQKKEDVFVFGEDSGQRFTEKAVFICILDKRGCDR